MSEEEIVFQPTGSRPHGEVVAHVYTPPMRFGLALSLGVKDGDGSVWVAQASQENGFIWVKIDPFAEPKPTMYLDDEMVAAMLKGLNEQPIKARGDYALDHLADALEIRNRLLDMIENVFNTEFKGR